MDATQKRRMWKVAFVHFAASIFVCYEFFGLAIRSHNFFDFLDVHDYSPSTLSWLEAWNNIFRLIAYLFQPIQARAIQSGSLKIVGRCLLTIPIWSLCFGWLFVKLDNWLNHFPVLGKKVF
jgi:hypothetical protein